MTWPQQALDASLDEALANGLAIVEPTDGQARTAAKLRFALYRRAAARGIAGVRLTLAEEKILIEVLKDEDLAMPQQPPEGVQNNA